jgi:hypothetical protein
VPPLISSLVHLLRPRAQAVPGAAVTFARATGVIRLPRARHQGFSTPRTRVPMASRHRRRRLGARRQRLGARRQRRQLRRPASLTRRFRGPPSTASASPTSLVTLTSNQGTRTTSRRLSATCDPKWVTMTASDPTPRLLGCGKQINTASITITRAAGFPAVLLMSQSRALGSRSARPISSLHTYLFERITPNVSKGTYNMTLSISY